VNKRQYISIYSFLNKWRSGYCSPLNIFSPWGVNSFPVHVHFWKVEALKSVIAACTTEKEDSRCVGVCVYASSRSVKICSDIPSVLPKWKRESNPGWWYMEEHLEAYRVAQTLMVRMNYQGLWTLLSGTFLHPYSALQLPASGPLWPSCSLWEIWGCCQACDDLTLASPRAI